MSSINEWFSRKVAATSGFGLMEREIQIFLSGEPQLGAGARAGIKHAFGGALYADKYGDLPLDLGSVAAEKLGNALEYFEKYTRVRPDSTAEIYKDLHNNYVGIVVYKWLNENYSDLARSDYLAAIGLLSSAGFIPNLATDNIAGQPPPFLPIGHSLSAAIAQMNDDKVEIESRVRTFLENHVGDVEQAIGAAPTPTDDIHIDFMDFSQLKWETLQDGSTRVQFGSDAEGTLRIAPDNSLLEFFLQDSSAQLKEYDRVSDDGARTETHFNPDGSRDVKHFDADGILEHRQSIDAAGRETIELVDRGGDVIGRVVEDASGEVEQVETGGVQLGAGDIGAALGSSLGRALGHGNALVEIGASALIGGILKAAGNAIELGIREALTANSGDGKSYLDGLVTKAVTEATSVPFQIGQQLQIGIAGYLSHLLVSELADALGLDGFEGKVFSVAGNAIVSRAIQNVETLALQTIQNAGALPANPGDVASILTNGFDVGSLGFNVGGAFASYFGSQLAQNILQPNNSDAALFASGAASVGVAAAGFAIGASLGAAAGSVIPVIGTFVGAFVGQLVGTFAGNHWFDDDDLAGITLGADGSGGIGMVGFRNWDGADWGPARSLAQTTINTVNSVLALTGSHLDANAPLATHEVGYYVNHWNQFYAFADGTQDYYKSRYGVREEALGHVARAAAESFIQTITITGGDPLLERAFYASRASGLVSLGFEADRLGARAGHAMPSLAVEKNAENHRYRLPEESCAASSSPVGVGAFLRAHRRCSRHCENRAHRHARQSCERVQLHFPRRPAKPGVRFVTDRERPNSCAV